jgi:hypothetical protein
MSSDAHPGLVLFIAVILILMPGCGSGSGSSAISIPYGPWLEPPIIELHPQQVFYVSPQGDDNNPGTEAQPFATIGRAQQVVRTLNAAMSGDLVVYLRQGVYSLTTTWALDQRDSGSNSNRVVWAGYPGEQVTISGAVPITNWTPDIAGRWKGQTSLGNFRQLYVNGQRAFRGRSGALNSPAIFGDTSSITGIAGYLAANPEMASWGNPADMELGFYQKWTHMICGVQGIATSVPGSQVAIAMKQPCFYFIRNKEGTQADLPAYIENALELTTSPGQFYLDRSSHTVYYVPRSGEDLTTADVEAPSLQTLLSVTGIIDTPVTNVIFSNITFAYTSWLGTSQVGFAEMQAAFRISQDLTRLYADYNGQLLDVNQEYDKTPGGIALTYAHNVLFDRCTFAHMGGSGLDLQLGSQNDTISGGRFFDISANAIQVGDVQSNDHHPSDTRMVLSGNRLLDSYIHDTGVEYFGSVGVFVGYTGATVIAHNEITRTPYTGVSIGWGWGMVDPGYSGPSFQPTIFTTPTPAQNNIVEYNNIRQVMQKSSDGGGVYTLGAQPGTGIYANLVHDNPNPPGGIYLDEGSTGITVAGNVIFGLQSSASSDAIFLHNNSTQQATCPVYGNTVGDPSAASSLTGQAGLEASYQDLLN